VDGGVRRVLDPCVAAAGAAAAGRRAHERLLDTVGSLVEGWAARWGFEFRLPPREVVRGIYAISRGMGLEALLADDPAAPEQFEEMFVAYAMGLIRERPGVAAPGEERLP
jgi:hypothetical protein